jgi:hypothetical protein
VSRGSTSVSGTGACLPGDHVVGGGRDHRHRQTDVGDDQLGSQDRHPGGVDAALVKYLHADRFARARLVRPLPACDLLVDQPNHRRSGAPVVTEVASNRGPKTSGEANWPPNRAVA